MGHGPDKQPNVGAVPHGIGTTPNITKPCGYCGGNGYVLDPKPGDPGSGGDSKPCPDCDGSGAEVVMKGGTPRIEDGAEVGGELSPEGVGHPPTADLSAGQERHREMLRALIERDEARDRAEKAEADNRALVEAIEEHFDMGGDTSSPKLWAARVTVSGQGENEPDEMPKWIAPDYRGGGIMGKRGQGEKP